MEGIILTNQKFWSIWDNEDGWKGTVKLGHSEEEMRSNSGRD